MILINQTMNSNTNRDIPKNKNKKIRRKRRKKGDNNDISDANEDIDEDIEEDIDEIDRSSVRSERSLKSLDDRSSINSSELSNTMIIDDKNNKKLFRNKLIQKRRPPVRMHSIHNLLRVCCNAFAYHRFETATDLMPAVINNKRSPHSFIIKAAFILFTQNPTNCDLLLKSMKKLSKYNVNKREIMLEVILYFLSNNDQIGAKKYIESNETYLKLNQFRSNSVIDPYLKFFICFVDYLEWKQSVEESNEGIVYHSSRMIAEKTKLSLKNLITETKDLVLDHFVLVLVEMYEYSQQFSEIFEILNIYINNNPKHLNAFIYLYNFSVKYPDYSTQDLQTNALKQIQKYSPENPLVLDSIQSNYQIVVKFETLMEFIDYNPSDIKAWTLLKDLISCIEDEAVRNSLKTLWGDIYEEYWLKYHFNVTKLKQMNENAIQLIECKQKVIQFFYSSSHSYVIQTDGKIEEYQSLFDY